MTLVKLNTILITTEITPSPTALKQSIGGLLKRLRSKDISIENESLFYDSANKYPLIQYHTDNNQPAISGYQEGADAIYSLFPHIDNLRFGRQEVGVDELWLGKTILEIDHAERPRQYRLHDYLGLNEKNYAKAKAAKDPFEQRQVLMRALAGQLRGAARGLGFMIEDYPRIDILRWGSANVVTYKKNQMTCLTSLDFTCDLILPPDIGIGKGAALGFGRLEVT